MGDLDFSIDVDASGAFRILEQLDDRIETSKQKLAVTTTDVERQTRQSFDHVLGMMRSSYMMVAGVSQLIGGNLGRVFSTMYNIGITTIGTYTAITAAIAASGPQGWIQAGIMGANLVTATLQLGALFQGQNDLARQMGGLTMSLHGLSGMIGVMGY